MGLKLDIFKYINEKLLFLIKIIKRNLHLARVSYGIKKTPFLFFSGKWNYCKNYWSEQLFMTKYLKNWDRSWLLDFTHFTILQRCFLWLLNSHVDLKTYVLVYSDFWVFKVLFKIAFKFAFLQVYIEVWYAK